MKLQGTMRINEAGHLEIGGVDTLDLVREFGTPLYVLDEQAFRENCRKLKEAFASAGDSQVIYASKALCTMATCLLVKEEGLGLDVVSGGELHTALAVDFPVEKIYFHGNNKTPEEIEMAVKNQVGVIVVDNFYEMELLNRICQRFGREQRIILRISPGIEAHTHEYIKTGQIDSKFGFTLPGGQALEAVKRLRDYPFLVYDGLHCHIGSQIFEMQSFAHTAEVMMAFVARIREETGLVTAELNLGGGFGIYYYEGDRPVPPEAGCRRSCPVLRKRPPSLGCRSLGWWWSQDGPSRVPPELPCTPWALIKIFRESAGISRLTGEWGTTPARPCMVQSMRRHWPTRPIRRRKKLYP